MMNLRYQFEFAHLLYQIGLIDLKGYKICKEIRNRIINHIIEGNYTAASTERQSFLNDVLPSLTGYTDPYNFLKLKEYAFWYPEYLNKTDVRYSLHVGNQTFLHYNDKVNEKLFDDISKNNDDWFSLLISKYQMLCYGSNLDMILGYPFLENYLQHLDFNAAEEYKTAPRYVWWDYDNVAGYWKRAGNLTEICIRNAGMLSNNNFYHLTLTFIIDISIIGHEVEHYQPKYVYQMLKNFTCYPLYLNLTRIVVNLTNV